MFKVMSVIAAACAVVSCEASRSPRAAMGPAAAPPALAVSEAVDALCLLSALSPDAPFAREYEAERAAWMEKLARVAGGQAAVAPWLGDAAFLVHVYAGTAADLAHLIAVVRGPIPDPDRVVEPTYRARLSELTERRESLARALEAIAAAGFDGVWRTEIAPRIDAAIPSLRDAMAGVAAARVDAALAPYLGSGKHGGPVYVAYFNRPFALSLPRGGAVVNASADPSTLWALIIHERLHGIDPSKQTLGLYAELGRADPGIGERQRTLLQQFHSSSEEEIVVAAELAVTVRLGLQTRAQALRRAATSYGGLPVASILFDKLMRDPPTNPPAFEAEVAGELSGLLAERNGTQRYAALVMPVAGTTGMRLTMDHGRPVIAEVFASTAAAKAGLAAGDEITAVEGTAPGGTLAGVLDQLVGSPEQPVHLRVRRGEQALDVTLVRGRLPTVPPLDAK